MNSLQQDAEDAEEGEDRSVLEWLSDTPVRDTNFRIEKLLARRKQEAMTEASTSPQIVSSHPDISATKRTMRLTPLNSASATKAHVFPSQPDPWPVSTLPPVKVRNFYEYVALALSSKGKRPAEQQRRKTESKAPSDSYISTRRDKQPFTNELIKRKLRPKPSYQVTWTVPHSHNPPISLANFEAPPQRPQIRHTVLTDRPNKLVETTAYDSV